MSATQFERLPQDFLRGHRDLHSRRMLSYLSLKIILVFPRIKEVLGHYFPVIISLCSLLPLSPLTCVYIHWQYPFIGSVIDPDSSETISHLHSDHIQAWNAEKQESTKTAISGEAPRSLSLSSKQRESVLYFSNLNAALLI